jgi:hypothetical protein
MIFDFFLAIIFTLLINWVVSLQLVAQFSETKNVKITSIALALFAGFLSGIIILL